MKLDDLETFVRVAEHGTFSAAAAQLGVPKSTVSRRVARLEEALGVALLKRSARSFELSDDGRALFERCGPPLRDIADVARDLGDSKASPRGRLRVSTSIDFGTTDFIAGLLTAYTERYPDVTVSLEITNRIVDLLEEGIDVSFRTHSGRLPSRDDLVSRRLGGLGIGIYSSPRYLRAHGSPKTVQDLVEHRTVAHRHAQLADWPATASRLVADDYRPAAAMLAAGAGIGILPDFVAATAVDQGRLVQVLPSWRPPPVTLSLVWLRSRHLAPRLRVFIDLAVEHAAQAGWCDAGLPPGAAAATTSSVPDTAAVLHRARPAPKA